MIVEVFTIFLPLESVAVPPLQKTAASVQVQPEEIGGMKDIMAMMN